MGSLCMHPCVLQMCTGLPCITCQYEWMLVSVSVAIVEYRV